MLQRIRISAVVLAASLAVRSVAAQGRRTDVEFSAQAGVLGTPHGYRFDELGYSRTTARAWPAFAFGAALDVRRPRRALGLQLQAVAAPWVLFHHADVAGQGQNSVVAGTASLVVAPASLCLRAFCPRVTAGGGVAYFRTAVSQGGDVIISVAKLHQARPAARLGLGAIWRTRRRHFSFDVSDILTSGLDRRDGPTTRVATHSLVALLGVQLGAVR